MRFNTTLNKSQVKVYGFNNYFELEDSELYYELESFQIFWELELNNTLSFLDSISIAIKGLYFTVSWSIETETLSLEELSRVQSKDKNCSQENNLIFGTIKVKVENGGSSNSPNWKIKNYVKFDERGGYEFNKCEIDLLENLIELY